MERETEEVEGCWSISLSSHPCQIWGKTARITMRTRKKRKLAAGRKAGVRKGHWNKRTTSIAYWVLNTVSSSRHGRSWVRRNTGRESETYKTWGFLEYSQRIEFMHSFNILFRTSYYTECWVGKDKQMWSYTLKNDRSLCQDFNGPERLLLNLILK